MRNFIGILAALIMLTTPAQAQHTLNVRDADVRAFVQDAARLTGRTFILDSRVQGKVSVVTDRPLSRSEYFEVFLSTLRANGLVAVPTRGGYRIQPADGAATQPSQIGLRGAAANQFVTEVVRLKSIVASEALETLRPLVSKQGSITANRNANSLVIVDYADNIRRIRQLVNDIDRDSAASTIINLKNAGAREIATSLQSLATQGGGEGIRAPVTVVPIDSSNSIALRGDPGAVAKFAQMARELDSRAELGTEIRVHRLDYASAEALLPVIEQLLGKSGSNGASAAGAAVSPAAGESGAATTPAAVSSSDGGTGISRRGPAIVTRLEGTNALIVAANPEVQRMVGELIRQLDTRQEQVVVEAIIVEISQSLAKELGIQWLIGGKDAPFAVTNFSNASPNIVDVAGGVLADQFDTSTTTTTTTATTTTTNSAVGDALRQNAADAVLAARGGFAGFATTLGSGGVRYRQQCAVHAFAHGEQ